jgi:hypothetical protein
MDVAVNLAMHGFEGERYRGQGVEEGMWRCGRKR